MMYKQKSSFARPRLLIGVFLILMSLITVVACAQGSAGSSPTHTSQPSLPAITIKARPFESLLGKALERPLERRS